MKHMDGSQGLKLIPKVDLIYEYKNPKYGPGPSTSMGPNIRKSFFSLFNKKNGLWSVLF